MNPSTTLSVVINTKNASKTLEAALKSVSFAHEIVVVDMDSQDDTIAIARRYTKLVFEHPDVGYVEPARNFAISHATGDWILILDADEEVPTTLREVIQQLVGIAPRSRLTSQLTAADCYYIARKNLLFNHWMQTGWWPDYVLRLFRKGHVEWSDEIHSIPVTSGKVAELPAQEQLALVHHNYQTLEQYLDRLNRYTTIEAQNHPQDLTPTPSDLIKSFKDEFLRRLFVDEGLGDGTHGAAMSLLQPTYQVVVQLKQWQAHNFKISPQSERETLQALRSWQRDTNYWVADWQVKHSRGLVRVWWQVRRKLAI